jgi:hypothetical protein
VGRRRRGEFRHRDRVDRDPIGASAVAGAGEPMSTRGRVAGGLRDQDCDGWSVPSASVRRLAWPASRPAEALVVERPDSITTM